MNFPNAAWLQVIEIQRGADLGVDSAVDGTRRRRGAIDRTADKKNPVPIARDGITIYQASTYSPMQLPT